MVRIAGRASILALAMFDEQCSDMLKVIERRVDGAVTNPKIEGKFPP